MDEGKIEIKMRGETVKITIANLTQKEIFNLLMNAMNDIIEETVEKKEERTAVAAFIGSALVKRFEEAEKVNDKI